MDEFEAKSYERYVWDCPECGAQMDEGDVQPAGETLQCDDCGISVVVT